MNLPRVSRLTICASMLFALSSIAWAQQSSEAPATAGTQGGEQSSLPQPAPKPSSKGSFTPSEEVSEDLSVSFPVDI